MPARLEFEEQKRPRVSTPAESMIAAVDEAVRDSLDS